MCITPRFSIMLTATTCQIRKTRPPDVAPELHRSDPFHVLKVAAKMLVNLFVREFLPTKLFLIRAIMGRQIELRAEGLRQFLFLFFLVTVF